jgi:hypothetical protein
MFLHHLRTALRVWYFSKCFSKWFLNCSDGGVFLYMISELLWHCCGTVPKSCRKTCRKVPHCHSSSEIMKKNTTLSEQFQNHVEKHVEKYNTVRAVPKSCSISYMISELFCQCSISYMISELFWQWYFSTWFWNCSDSVVFFYMFFYMILQLFWQCGIAVRTVPKSCRKTCRKI